jgi:hypothetical protein
MQTFIEFQIQYFKYDFVMRLGMVTRSMSSITPPDGWIRAPGVLGPGWMRVQIGGSTPQGWVNI